MSGNICKRLLLGISIMLCAEVYSSAQAYGSYTPYSIFGVGDIYNGGSAYTATMGGVGIATRNNHFINPMNPAAVTARDSLAFMADVSMYNDGRLFKQNSIKSSSNTTNISSLILTFPIYRSSAMMVGVMPYSSTGFGYISSYLDDKLVSEMGNINYSATGQGAVYQVFAAGALTLWDRISLGAEAIYYFGNTEKSYYETISDASYLGSSNGHNLNIKGLTGKFGVQFSQNIGSGCLTAGATYRLATNLKGSVESYRYSSGSAATDTLYHKITDLSSGSDGIRLGSEMGFGINYSQKGRWSAEINYTRSDWTSSGMDKADGFAGNLIPGSGSSIFSTSVSQGINAGFEFIPNSSDIRYYFNRCAYRAGAYFKSDYFKLDGHDIMSYGVTFGLTMPVFRWYNGLTLGIDLGRRGSAADNLIRETYVKFNIGVNIFDIWFQKPQYN